jgi:ubiquinone/menaquinone biosynthesis C-methylase UbiE
MARLPPTRRREVTYPVMGPDRVASNLRPLRGTGAGSSEPVRRFDGWAASYDLSQLQSVLYGPVHDAVLRYAQQRVQRPGRILDVGCGTGRLPARLASGYHHARVVGVDASTEMIKKASATAIPQRAHFSAAAAERLPFADGVFDLVVVTLSMSHWCDKAAGLAEISRVMAPGASLVAADVSPSPPVRPRITWAWRKKPTLRRGLLSAIAAGGFRVEHVEPIRSVALITDAALVVARKPGPPESSRASL